jgi:hypothetical protein
MKRNVVSPIAHSSLFPFLCLPLTAPKQQHCSLLIAHCSLSPTPPIKKFFLRFIDEICLCCVFRYIIALRFIDTELKAARKTTSEIAIKKMDNFFISPFHLT